MTKNTKRGMMASSTKAEVWMADMHGRGHEQRGGRPVILWRDLDHVKMAIIIPFTTAQESSRFPHTCLVSPTIQNGLSEDSIALIFQITSIDKNRLVKRLGELDTVDITSIGALLKELLRI